MVKETDKTEYKKTKGCCKQNEQLSPFVTEFMRALPSVQGEARRLRVSGRPRREHDDRLVSGGWLRDRQGEDLGISLGGHDERGGADLLESAVGLRLRHEVADRHDR